MRWERLWVWFGARGGPSPAGPAAVTGAVIAALVLGCCRCAASAIGSVEDIQARALVAFSRALAEQGLLLEAASVARLAAAGCRARRCRGEALVAGAEALLWRRQPHAATDLYAQALESDALWWRPQERARVLFCYAMAAQEANRPRLCTTYLYQARAAASSVQTPLSSFLDVRCVTPQLGWVAASLVASGTADPEGLLDRVAAVSANYTASLDLAARVETETAADGGELAYPTFLPEGARQIWFGGQGGEAWNEGVLARVQLPETTPVRKAVELWREWGVVSVAQILPEEFCKGLEGYFERVVGENSTMAFETGKPVAAHSSEELVLRDFILASLTEAGGDVALAVAALLDYLNPFLEVLELTPGSIVGLGQAAAYAGASVGPIRRASAPFTEQQLQHMQSASKGAASCTRTSARRASLASQLRCSLPDGGATASCCTRHCRQGLVPMPGMWTTASPGRRPRHGGWRSHSPLPLHHKVSRRPLRGSPVRPCQDCTLSSACGRQHTRWAMCLRRGQVLRMLLQAALPPRSPGLWGFQALQESRLEQASSPNVWRLRGASVWKVQRRSQRPWAGAPRAAEPAAPRPPP
mmetsp:Transcript_155770/g.499343  ORF Transcript_155770/g.499343 Transcript_155770/m.499343 type:complete len:587 (-) Transcript_155770:99-1859(-)